MFMIKRHAFDRHGFAEFDGRTVYRDMPEVDAVNQLFKIADTYTGNGWIASGGGYVLELTSATGTRVLYRVWRQEAAA